MSTRIGVLAVTAEPCEAEAVLRLRNITGDRSALPLSGMKRCHIIRPQLAPSFLPSDYSVSQPRRLQTGKRFVVNDAIVQPLPLDSGYLSGDMSLAAGANFLLEYAEFYGKIKSKPCDVG
jgi:hypothetical protein